MTTLNVPTAAYDSVSSIPPLLKVDGLTKRYRTGDPLAVDKASFELHSGDILALLGPSGCGKSTTLRMIAGFERPDQGQLFLHGKNVTALTPQQRRIGIVFQDYALFPHMTLSQNVAFAMRHIPKAKRADKAREWLDLVGLADLGRRMPDELSGGQQQRVALARTLAAEPELILLDEPFSNLDAALRESTRKEVRTLFKASNTTAILVTHDQGEALSFADQVGVMNAGKLLQIDRPEDIYQRPTTAFVAEFLGHTNLLEGEAAGDIVQTALGPVGIDTSAYGPVEVSLRPEHLSMEPTQGEQGATIIEREFRGHDCFYVLEKQGQRFTVITPSDTLWNVGEQAKLTPRLRGSVVGEQPSRQLPISLP
ncbi:ABC transporter ATP-binding protein [Vreelandella olivaria]|uniref:ABC transporter ATP-binding protein n=1 Tax=Vreelandella olivaria TaxID=390919 RepID=UPI00201EF4CB|nr:ABC transporter ATP-binding protein [Halomonas olivaria]